MEAVPPYRAKGAPLGVMDPRKQAGPTIFTGTFFTTKLLSVPFMAPRLTEVQAVISLQFWEEFRVAYCTLKFQPLPAPGATSIAAEKSKFV